MANPVGFSQFSLFYIISCLTEARFKVILATLVAISAVAFVTALLIASSRDNAGPSTIVHGSSPFKGAERPKIATQDFTLKDENGREVSLFDYRGKLVALTFLYSNCEESCPLQARMIAGALDDLGQRAADVQALAVSVDPASDTPRSVKRFLTKTRTYGRMRYLMGSRRKLQPVWRQFAIQPQGKGFDHTAYIILIDRQGRQRVGHPAGSTTPEQIAHDLEVLIKRG